MNNLTFAYWVRNEEPYVAEWVEFHRLQGVDYFILYDNKSTDRTKEICKPYIDIGILEIRDYPKEVVNRNNFWMMTNLTRELVGKTKWLHYGALDERVFSPLKKPLPEILDEYSQFGGLCVAWEEFNSSGKLKKEPGLIIERFTETCKDTANHIKTIVRPECVINHVGNPHNFIFKPGFCAVDENRQVIPNAWNNGIYTFNKIKNHHYRTLSREEFDRKMSNGLLDHAGQENIRRPDADEQWEWCHVKTTRSKCEDLLEYVVDVKREISNTYKNYPNLYNLVKDWYNL
jgi:hypothetical protein